MIKIRHALKSDIFQVYDLWEYLLEDEAETLQTKKNYPGVDSDQKETMNRFAKDFNKVLKNPSACLIVAEEHGILVGYVKANVGERPLGNPRFFLMIQEAYTMPEYRKTPQVISSLDAALDSWAEELEKKYDTKLPTRELIAISSPTQIKRWRRKGWTPYAVMFWRER